MAVKFSNNAVTTLSASISSGATSFSVASASLFPTLTGSDWTYITIDVEVIKITAISGTTFTCDATTTSHSLGDNVELRMTAELLNDFAEDTEALPIGGGTLTGNLSLGDNVKAQFGDGNDLQIYHDPTTNHSYIRESGAGDLRIRGTGISLRSESTDEPFLNAVENGAVTLYHNNLSKLATTSTGIDVTGTVTCDGLSIASNANATITGDGVGFVATDDSGPSIQMYAGDTTTELSTSTYHPMMFKTNNTERMRINEAGNIGMGTNNPTAKLQLHGGMMWFTGVNANSANIEGLGLFGGTTAQGIYARGDATGTDNDFSIMSTGFIKLGSNNIERLRIDSSGNVGIGTSSPNDSLEILKSGGASIRLSETSNRYVKITGYAEGTANGSTMAFSTVQSGTTTLTERMRIDSDGNVGIGKPSNLGAALHIDPATNVSTTFGSPLVKVGGDNSWASTGSLYSVGFGYTNSAELVYTPIVRLVIQKVLWSLPQEM